MTGPSSLNRWGRGYVSNEVTSRKVASGHRPRESLAHRGHIGRARESTRDTSGYADSERPTRPLRILVVGAGVGGISVARGLLRDGHDVTVFDRRPDVKAGGGAVTIWSNGATVLEQLGVDMDGAGQLLSTLRVITSTGRPVATVDVTAIVNRLGAPVRMVPRRVLLERLLEGFPAERIRCNARAVGVVSTHDGVRVEFEDGSWTEGDLLIGADGLHSMVRDVVGAQSAEPTGWCSWQGLVTLPDVVDKHVAQDDYRRARKCRRVAGWRFRCAVVVRPAVVLRLRQTATSD